MSHRDASTGSKSPHTQAQASRAPCPQGSTRSHSSYDGWPATTACRRRPRSAALHRAALCGVARCSDGPQVRVVRRRQVLLHTHQRGASWGTVSSAVLVGDFGGRCSSRLTPRVFQQHRDTPDNNSSVPWEFTAENTKKARAARGRRRLSAARKNPRATPVLRSVCLPRSLSPRTTVLRLRRLRKS